MKALAAILGGSKPADYELILTHFVFTYTGQMYTATFSAPPFGGSYPFGGPGSGSFSQFIRSRNGSRTVTWGASSNAPANGPGYIRTLRNGVQVDSFSFDTGGTITLSTTVTDAEPGEQFTVEIQEG